MGVKRIVARALESHPRLFFPAVRLFAPGKYRGHLVDRDTELVVSGYPRSANSFATMAVYESQQRAIEIASHVHVPAEVLEAVRLGLPTVVVIRRPEDAIRSLKAAMPDLDENRELRRWIRYYARVEPLHEHFVVSPFERTINDFGSVIDEVNARFGTCFRRFETTEESRARVFERLRQSQERFGTGRFGGEPSEERRARLQQLPLSFDRKLLARAADILTRFEDLSGWPGKRPQA